MRHFENQLKYTDGKVFNPDPNYLTDHDKMVLRYILNRFRASQKFSHEEKAMRRVTHFPG